MLEPSGPLSKGSTDTPAVRAKVSGDYGWSVRNSVALFLLALSGMYTQLDRTMIGFLLPLIKADLRLSDTVLGLVIGPAFLIIYIFMVIPMAWLADNTNRKLVLGYGFIFFSLMTMVTGAVNNLWQLIVARAFVGAGESTNLGPLKSIVADMFERRHRVIALSATSASTTLSGLVMIPIIGIIAQAYGWGAAFYAAGGSGIICAILLLAVVHEPRAGASDGQTEPSEKIPLLTSLKILAHSPTYLLLAAGGALISTFVAITMSWETSFLVRVHEFSIGEAAILVGPLKSSASLLGLVAGASIAKMLSTDKKRAMLMPVSAAGLAITELVFLLADAPWLWKSAVVISGVFVTLHMGVMFSILSMLVVPRVRGVAVAAFATIAHLVGQTVGPVLIGFLNDTTFARFGTHAIRYSLLVAVAVALVALLAFLLAVRRIEGRVMPTES